MLVWCIGNQNNIQDVYWPDHKAHSIRYPIRSDPTRGSTPIENLRPICVLFYLFYVQREFTTVNRF